jgi:uroporphyrin-III C-methyltransferase
MIMGTLFLVGAGPGDPELITVKAMKTLRMADVILYDALANPELLDYCPSGAVRHFVGKRNGCHSLSQHQINQLIVAYASRHKVVVRLKGGDPFVFGRAQEEIDAAREAGCRVEVVPGVSSVFSVPQSVMIPLTCRGINESFWVATGTTQTGSLSPDIEIAAASNATVVLLMAMSKLPDIVRIFERAGKADLPAVIIQNGTLPEQKVVSGTVSQLAELANEAQISNPAVIVIGNVVALMKHNLQPMLQAIKLAS